MLNQELLLTARKRVPCVPLLINLVSKRVKQLNAGFRPLIKPESPDEERVNIALREIAEGKMTAEIEFSAQPAGAADRL